MSHQALLEAPDPVILWPSICELLKKQLPRRTFLTWFVPIKPVFADDSRVTLQVPSKFYFDWIESHYGNILRNAITEVTGSDYAVQYSTLEDEEDEEEDDVKIPESTQTRVAFKGEQKHQSHLNSNYTFDTFIEGECNRFARNAAATLALSPGQTPYNPLLIHGGSGLGKTHLLQAVGNRILQYKASLNVVYITGKEFTENYVAALQSSKMNAFNKMYRAADVLLMDDVQFFLSRERTQEEFFHLFNTLHQLGKQLVLTSDRSPKDLSAFDERLISRLQWGLVAEIKSPEFETRESILKTKALEFGVTLPDEVTQFLAINITENIRALHGAIVTLMAQTSLMNQPVTLDIARDAIKNMVKRPMRKVSIERIQEIVANEFGISADDIRSKTRKKEIAEARQIAMYFSSIFTNITLKAIGLQFGGRNYATVIHSRDLTTEKINQNKHFANLVEKLKKDIELSSL